MLLKFSGYALSVLFAFASILFQSSTVQALSCYQGQIMIGQTVKSSLLTPCTHDAKACIKQMDFYTRIQQLGCSTTNCTDQQGRDSSESICTNMTQPPYLQRCCCYGDGCNEGPGEANYTNYYIPESTNVQSGVSSRSDSSFMLKPSGLKCYQGQTMIGQTFNSSQLMPCTFNAYSCVTQKDFQTGVEQRGSTGQYSSEPICTNMTQPPYLQQCCCYGDGCNWGPEEANYTMAPSTNVQNGVPPRSGSSFMSRPSSGLRCYQGRTMTGQTVNSSLLGTCTFNANTCVTQKNFQTGVEQRGCMTNNCTDVRFQHGEIIHVGSYLCTNMTQPPYLQQCCCYEDGSDVQSGVSSPSDPTSTPIPSSRLKCYQGQNIIGQAVNDSQLMPCTFNAYSCVKQMDFNSRVEQRGCQTRNCTDQQGRYSSDPICTNMTSPPYLQQCCCYGDGCNWGPEEAKYKMIQSTNVQNGLSSRSGSTFTSIPSSQLSCYQAQLKIGQTVNSSFYTQCARNANACLKQTDFFSGVVQFGCMTNNCTDQQGQYSAESICTNMTQPPYLQRCCCYGDGCNGGPGGAPPQAGPNVWINSVQLLLKSLFS
ncbi:hypothetical protein Ddc_16414 [Ditylenchus destructor]|nr:hypothetical protein Ddc_16414 [Ditylenchus destructor]